MDILAEEIVELIRTVCAEESVIFLKAVRQRQGKANLIRVTVDTENGITLGQCQNVSQKISDMFFRKNILEGNYQLEVSSPGVEKNLEFPYEYRRNIGRPVDVLHWQNGVLVHSLGKLVYYDQNVLRLRSDETETEIPINQIKRTQVKLQW